MKFFKNHPILFILAMASLLHSSCDIINPDEQIPSYIQIDSITVGTNLNANAGSTSSNIVDAWVFIDDEMIGIFELPAKIPVLSSGKHKLTIGPGILISTVSTLRENYLFYNAYIDNDFQLNEGEITQVNPKITYRDASSTYEYIVVEDFEQAFVVLDSFSGSQQPITKTKDPQKVFEGSGSGLVSILQSDSVAVFKTPNYELPGSGKAVYLEVNYKSDFAITIGVFANNKGYKNEVVDLVTLLSTTDDEDEKAWKKAYIELTSVTSAAANPEDFYIFFSARIENDALRKNGELLIDNIKLLYQK
jgi:hypothetical protein